MARHVQDHYFREAKREGYRSRAAYKLKEIDDRKRILRLGDRVLDLGCVPGAWLQVAAERVGVRGIVVGVDLQRVEPLPQPNVITLQADVNTVTVNDIRRAADLREGERFDCIISDLAPGTTGDALVDHHGSIRLCQRALELTDAMLREGGSLIMKAFEGEAYPELLRETQSRFEKAKGFKPKASRDESREMYIIAERLQRSGASPSAAEESSHASAPAPPRPPRAPGWGHC